jgi:N-methylhydantoinase A
MRYVGQSHEIRVPLPTLGGDAALVEKLRTAFDAAYVRLYHRTNPAAQVETLNWRLIATGPRPSVRITAAPLPGEAYKGDRPAWLPEAGGMRPCPVFDRYRLRPGDTLSGPAIVEERESTAIIGPGHVTVDEQLNLLVTLEEKR